MCKDEPDRGKLPERSLQFKKLLKTLSYYGCKLAT